MNKQVGSLPRSVHLYARVPLTICLGDSPAMSLTSRLSSFFSQGNSSATSIDTAGHGFAEPTLDIVDGGTGPRRRPRTMEPMAEEDIDFELKRPPYLHVCVTSPPTIHRIDHADGEIVDAGGGHRRDQR